MLHYISTEEKLQERIKELSCLYDISLILAKHEILLPNTLEAIGKVLKKAWRFSGDALVEIKLENYFYLSEEIKEKTVFQHCEINLFSSRAGYVKVHYPASRFSEKHFLPEEKKLLEKVASDISTFYEKQKNKEKETILELTAQRNDRLLILGEITAGIAHELNTPLGNVLGFAELIESGTKNKQIQADIKKIIQSTIYSREIVKKLMFFACEMPQHMEVIKIKPVIEQVLNMLGPSFKKADISYSFQIEDPEVSAQLDSIQLNQVLFNLIMNAISVSPKKGKIDIRVKNDSEFLIIEIADEGPGIEEEVRSRIFEPFFSTKPLGEGSGLGLSVVHGIVKSHRGNITTFDNKPKGTVFQVKLHLTH